MFFFKRKTAYEMRISDWSSDVCSSDLLLNGRRMAYGGRAQSVDISAIPVEAVERIEIVPDGASAIYGSDAVAGVGNVIIQRDFEGVPIGTRFGTASSGGFTTRSEERRVGKECVSRCRSR